MNFIRRHWYDIGLGLTLVTLIWLASAGVQRLQLILLLNLVVLWLLEFEEYHFPGGFPWICNEVLSPKGGPVDRYPLNQNNAALINISVWLFYLIPALFPEVIWFGLGQVLFGLVGQVIVHGIVINRKLKTWYNPGLVAVLLGHVPLGIWYLVEVTGQRLLHWSDWIFGVLYVAAFGGILMQYSFHLLADRSSPYPFAPEEMARFDREGRLRRAGITASPLNGRQRTDQR